MKRPKPKTPPTPPPEPSTHIEHANESVCERARRIAREEQAAARRDREAKRAAFLDTICAPHERTLNDDGTYTICGWRWTLWVGHDDIKPYLVCHDTYKGQFIDKWAWRGFRSGNCVYSVSDLGRTLLAFDERKAEIDAAQSESFWARFKRLFT